MMDASSPRAAPYYDPREVELHNRFASRLVDVEATYKPGLYEMLEVLDRVEAKLGNGMRAGVKVYGGDFDEGALRECVALRRLFKFGCKILEKEAAVAEVLKPRFRGRAA